jgi:hypothetical protein
LGHSRDILHSRLFALTFDRRRRRIVRRFQVRNEFSLQLALTRRKAARLTGVAGARQILAWRRRALIRMAARRLENFLHKPPKSLKAERVDRLRRSVHFGSPPQAAAADANIGATQHTGLS